MGISDQIGQMLIFGWDSDSSGNAGTLNNHARALIDQLRVGGIILMRRNVEGKSCAEVATLVQSLQIHAEQAGLPPLMVYIDQEGGRVSRLLPPEFGEHPPAINIGKTRDPEVAYLAAKAIGDELREVGIHCPLAPVLDVNNNPANPVIGDRSYGASQELVAELGAAAVAGFQFGAGVMACGKHFPGHGDTTVDSHFDLPVINHSREHLDEIELLPFQGAIEDGICAIMTAHILFPALDPKLPASLSPLILQGILRGELGFDGLIMTDCLEMDGIAKTFGTAEGAALAATAGADLLLVCHTLTVQKEVFAALTRAVTEGRLTSKRIRESNQRIERMKERWIFQ